MSTTQGVAGGLYPAMARLPYLSPRLWMAAGILAAAAALLPGLWTLAGLGALAVCTLVVARPELAIYLLTLSVPFGSLLEIEVGKLTLTPTEVLVALLVVGWAARALARGNVQLPLTPLSVPLSAMLAAVAISAYQATELALTLKETLKWLELTLVYLFVVAEMGTIKHALALLALLLAGAGLEALLGFAQFALGIGPDFFAIGNFMRAYGTFEQPNPYAGYLGMLIPPAVGLLLGAWSRPRFRYYVLATGVLATIAVLMSLSRGAWVGISLSLTLMMLFWSRRSLILLVAGTIATSPLAALAFLNLLPYEVSSRLATVLDYFRFIDVNQEIATPQNWAVLERVAHWQAALDMIGKQPLWGVGAGNYPAVYFWYAVPGWWDPLGHAHNFYLNIAAETGIPGLLVYLSLLAVAMIHAMKWLAVSGRGGAVRREGEGPPEPPGAWEGAVRQEPHPPEDRAVGDEPLPYEAAVGRPEDVRLWRAILLGVLGALVASSVHNMFDSLFVHSMSVQLGMILALGQLSAAALSRPWSQPVS